MEFFAKIKSLFSSNEDLNITEESTQEEVLNAVETVLNAPRMTEEEVNQTVANAMQPLTDEIVNQVNAAISTAIETALEGVSGNISEIQESLSSTSETVQNIANTVAEHITGEAPEVSTVTSAGDLAAEVTDKETGEEEKEDDKPVIEVNLSDVLKVANKTTSW